MASALQSQSTRPFCMKGGQHLHNKSALWIKDPLSILADAAERGVVIKEGRIAELVPAGRAPTISDTAIFEAGDHVVLPGLINTHHHFFQTLTRAAPAALDRELFPWLQALYPIWAGLTPEALELAATVAMSELIPRIAWSRTRTPSSPTANG